MTRLPDFLVVGPARTGTTSLHRYLDRHPDVHMCPVKETRFFADVWDEAADDPARLAEARAGYRALFSDAGDAATVGETDPRYVWHPEAPERIEATLEDPRIVVSVRDPVERAHSQYLVDLRHGTPTAPFPDRVRDELSRLDDDPRTLPLVRGSLYHRNVARYVERFGRDRVHAVEFARLVADPRDALARVCRFLGVAPDPVEAIDVDVAHNPSGLPVSRRLYDLVHGSGWLQAIARRLLPERIRVHVGDHLLVSDDKPSVDPRAATRLAKATGPEIRRLEALLDREFPDARPDGHVSVGSTV